MHCIILSIIGKLSPEDLDERAMDALKEYNPDDAIAVLKQFCESSLEHVGNKSAFLCGMMKTYRQNKKQGAQASPARGPDPNKLSVSQGQKKLCVKYWQTQKKDETFYRDFRNSSMGFNIHNIKCWSLCRKFWKELDIRWTLQRDRESTVDLLPVRMIRTHRLLDVR